MANTIITNAGKSFITSAGDDGVLIAVKYFVPVYDYRLDNNIHTGLTSAISYQSTIATTSAQTYPTGELIWNRQGYNLSTSFITSGVGDDVDPENPTHLSAYKQSSMGIGANTFNELPLNLSWSGTNFDPPNSTTNYWDITDIGSNIGDVSATNYTFSDRNYYWSVDDYYPVIDSSGNSRGTFKCHIGNAVGRFKFNKVAMYAVSVDANGNEDLNVLPVFFAEAFVKEVCVKSNIVDEGFDDYLVDVQINMNPLNNYWTSAFFAFSGTGWSPTVGGLYYSNSIGVGSFINSTDAPKGSIHVRHTNLASTSANPLIVMDGIGSNLSATIDVVSASPVVSASVSGSYITTSCKGIKTNSIVAESDNDLSVIYKLYIGGADDRGVQSDLVPNADDTRSLGNTTKAWKNGYINNISANNISANNIYIKGIMISEIGELTESDISTRTVTGIPRRVLKLKHINDDTNNPAYSCYNITLETSGLIVNCIEMSASTGYETSNLFKNGQQVTFMVTMPTSADLTFSTASIDFTDIDDTAGYINSKSNFNLVDSSVDNADLTDLDRTAVIFVYKLVGTTHTFNRIY